ncbi:MAG: serine/threonine protein kinase [Planctomycetes bacterium]|nr:serine/threonine protein kinase [Planctomycetota bacterium]
MQQPSPQGDPLARGPRPLTVDDFLRLVLRSRLLDRAELQAVLRNMPPEGRDRPEAVAGHLVKQGKLSRFQARKLLSGSCMGLLLGTFQILAPIGRGAMGTVYLARDQRSGLLLALKVLPPRKAREADRLLARFRREMEMSQRVAHPHLAWTCEVGVCKGIYYIAMEYIPGKSLHRLVAEGGPLPVARAARLLAEVASALEHTHTQGLVHRDIKPANILVTPNDHAKVLDLGLALAQGEKGGDREVIGGQGYVVGTMDYIAPEQIDDPLQVDGRADIYSLGCTLYYVLTSLPPFPGGTSKEKIRRQREETPPPISERNPSVPPAFAALVEKMMAKDPAQRFRSAGAVETELRLWQDNTVLPLDQPGDRAYELAVADIETAEPLDEQVDDPILIEETPSSGVEKAAYRRDGGLGRLSRVQWLTMAVILAGLLLAILVLFLLPKS